jgi:hypothetical protein
MSAKYSVHFKLKTLSLMVPRLMLVLMLMPLAFNARAQGTLSHVYYGYVPPTTSIATSSGSAYAGGVDEISRGVVVNYTVPANVAILDVAGIKDNTKVEIWDVYADQLIASATINRLEKKHFYIPSGTFFKLASSERVAAFLGGGSALNEPDGREEPPGGTSTFYPSTTGGFRGREFIFVAAPATHPFAYSKDRIGYNFYLFALKDTDWSLADAAGIWSTSGQLTQRGTRTLLLQSRLFHQGTHGGAGSDTVFHLTTANDAEVSSCAIGDFVAVPALTGGYVGKLFYAPEAVTFEDGRSAAFIVVPLQAGEVKVYDGDLNTIATHSFTDSDVETRRYWYYNLGVGRFNFIVESTGDICFMVGQTEGSAEIEFLGDDITFVGARPNQEVRFYAPTMAVLFAPEDSTVTIDGGAPLQMKADSFRLLESGVHSVVADKHVVVELLASGVGWNGWGSYLIEPADVDVSFEAPEGLLSKPVNMILYGGIAAVVVVVVALAAVLMRRRKAKQ